MERGKATSFAPLIDFLGGFIDLTRSDVLDLGCGSGGISAALSQHCRQLTSADIKQSNVATALKKATVPTFGCQLDASTLPFRDDSFDLVVVNGVLEWVPDAHDGDPRKVQVDTLREIRRVLRPDGVLYIGIEPRFYAKYLIGLTDHSGLRFSSPLPRALAHRYSRLLRGRRYGNYLYTIGGYRRLLREAGFEDVVPAAALPSYKVPQEIVPLDEFDRIRRAIPSVDEPRWRRIVRRVLATNKRLFELSGSELALVASTN